MSISRSTAWFAILSLAIAGSACGDGSTDPDPEPGDPVLSAVSGTGQTATAGQALANPLVVRVTRDGAPLAGRNVTWSVTTGGGSVDPTTSSTDASGNASTTWTLGPTAGAQSAEATASGVTGTVSFAATAEAEVPPPTNAEVSVLDNSFDPEAATVATGGTVTWTWGGAVDHNVTFSSGPSSPTQTTGTFERTFNDTGVFDYQCSIHGSSMSGTITVVAPS